MRLGRRTPVHTLRTMRSALVLAKALDPLGSPPTVSNDYYSAVENATGGDYGLLGNDRFGCCVEADDGHFLMLRTANTGQIVIPTTEDILALYSAETGFSEGDPSSDQGTDETSDCAYMVKNGLLGHKAEATGMVDPENLDHLRWAVQLFGGCKLGVRLPKSAMDQFNSGQPWSVVANDGGIEGGHDILGVGYVAAGLWAVTWGKRVLIAWDWLTKYLEEAHALLFPDFIRSTGLAPSGFSLSNLLADLPKVA